MSQMVISTSAKHVASQPNGTASADTLFNATMQSKPYPINNADIVTITVYESKDAGSTATVALETAPTVTGPWFDVTSSAPITDPSATGVQWSIPRAVFVRLNVTTYAAGNIRATIDAWAKNGAKIY